MTKIKSKMKSLTKMKSIHPSIYILAILSLLYFKINASFPKHETLCVVLGLTRIFKSKIPPPPPPLPSSLSLNNPFYHFFLGNSLKSQFICCRWLYMVHECIDPILCFRPSIEIYRCFNVTCLCFDYQ